MIRVGVLVLLTFFPSFSTAQAKTSTFYRVTRVVDGDTVLLAGSIKIRLIGVDTPETKHPTKPVQRFGKEAYEFLKKILNNKKVRMEYDQTRTDKYGRTLAYLYLEDGTFVNAQIIEQGYGFAYTRFPFKHMEQFRKLERDARENKKGLWAGNPEINVNTAGEKPAKYTCTKKTCSEISSCEEAKYLLNECGYSRLDGDSDGIPCEKLCGG